jgi:flagellar motor protein MotB
MAGKGGGAWKVAYADFVTAMMAFFLVMWLCSQDQKVKKAVADYFGDPYSFKFGTSKSPNRKGAVFQAITSGSVPDAESAAMGQGRDSNTAPGEPSPATKAVGDWLAGDNKAMEYWKEQAKKLREKSVRAKDAGESIESVDKHAAQQLSKLLKTEMLRGIPPQANGIYKDLLNEIISEVNWTEVAEDLLGR